MINNVVLVGRLTKDPELRYASTTNNAFTKFTLAVNRAFSSNNGEKQTDFISCTAFKKQAENLAKYTAKGSLIGIQGSITTRSYDNNEGKKVYVTEIMAQSIQFLSTNKNNNEQNGQFGDNQMNNQFNNSDFNQFGNNQVNNQFNNNNFNQFDNNGFDNFGYNQENFSFNDARSNFNNDSLFGEVNPFKDM